MIIDPLLSAYEADIEVGACAEDGPMACDDNAAHAVVGVKEAEDALQLLHHRLGESIVLARPVQRHDHDRGRRRRRGRVVRELDVPQGEIGV